jgi:hypothetical protein
VPFVLAAVELRVDELLDQVPLRGQELDPVEPCFRRKLRGARVADNDLLDLRGGECPRLGAESRARHRRRRERRSTRRRRDLLPAAVQELDEEPRAVRLHRSGHTPVACDDRGEVAAEGVRGQEPGRVHRCRFEHDKADAAASPRLVVGDELISRHVVVDERRLVRGRDDPVPQLDWAER